MKSKTLRTLLDGQYICEHSFAQEYEYLTQDGNASWVNSWLSSLEMRLTRVCEDGAFFMTPIELKPSDSTRIRDEFLRFRNTHGRFVKMLQVIRSAKDDFTLQPGEFLQHAELVQTINESASLTTQLRSLIGVIFDTEARFNNSQLVKKLLEHLKKEGYLVVFNESTEMYRTTGKLTQLTQVLTFLSENSEIGSRQETVDAVESDDLFDQVESQ